MNFESSEGDRIDLSGTGLGTFNEVLERASPTTGSTCASTCGTLYLAWTEKSEIQEADFLF